MKEKDNPDSERNYYFEDDSLAEQYLDEKQRKEVEEFLKWKKRTQK